MLCLEGQKASFKKSAGKKCSDTNLVFANINSGLFKKLTVLLQDHFLISTLYLLLVANGP